MKYLLILILPLMLIGCDEGQDAVDDKSVARWQALADKDYDLAYSFFAESYKKIEDLNNYRLRMATAQLHTQWQGAKFISKTCEKMSCNVEVEMSYKYQFPKASMGEVESKVLLNENWVNENGSWKLVPSAQQDLNAK